MTAFGAIADDFTGATDLAAMIARAGVAVSLRLGVPDTRPEDAAPVEVVALKCRSAPKAEAVAETGAALAWLRAAGAGRIYWKYCSTFDSTPEGNIGPVADALMDALGTDRTVHVPAFPENGRSVYMGHLFVGGQLLSESPMKDHPLTPMRDSDLTRLLAPQIRGAARSIPFPVVAQGAAAVRAAVDAEAGAAGPLHLVPDAICAEDIEAIAGGVAHLALACGGSALGGALARVLRDAGRLTVAPPGRGALPEGGRLVLAGSCSAATREQIERYMRDAASFRLDPIALASGDGQLEEALAWLRGLPAGGDKIVYATAAPGQVAAAQRTLGAARAGALVETALAHIALAARDAGIRRIVVAGGESSGAVVQALAVPALTVGAEIAPGVPWCIGISGGVPMALALKSGNFGRPDFFADAYRVAG